MAHQCLNGKKNQFLKKKKISQSLSLLLFVSSYLDVAIVASYILGLGLQERELVWSIWTRDVHSPNNLGVSPITAATLGGYSNHKLLLNKLWNML